MVSIWKPALGVACAGAVATAAIVGAGGGRQDDDPGDGAATGLDGIWPQRPAVVSDADPTARTRTVESLAGILDREVEERLRLEDEVERLRARLAELERTLGAGSAASPKAAFTRDPAGGSRGEVTEASFIAAGFDRSEASDYRRRIDEAAMARLYLRDQAQREGWLNSERYRQALAGLPNVAQELRAEMDDETYARFLYATGRPNQVRVRRVLAGSAAEAAGLQTGDVLLRYDGERVYNTQTVRRETRDGRAGDSVDVEVLRDGRRLQFYLPRGPIGVNMASESVAPDQNRS